MSSTAGWRFHWWDVCETKTIPVTNVPSPYNCSISIPSRSISRVENVRNACFWRHVFYSVARRPSAHDTQRVTSMKLTVIEYHVCFCFISSYFATSLLYLTLVRKAAAAVCPQSNGEAAQRRARRQCTERSEGRKQEKEGRKKGRKEREPFPMNLS